MTDKQRIAQIDKAVAALKKTTRGYDPEGVHWRVAMNHLRLLRADLVDDVTKVPNLGPIYQGGISVLLHSLTHDTSGLDGFPAFDDGFGRRGIPVLAPEGCVVYRQSSSQGGDAFYIRGDSMLEYWVGHVAAAPATSKRFKKGERMAVIADISKADGGPHVHLGINATPLIGHTLLYGKTGKGPDYTFGSPTVGAQLAKALEA